jgi:hypothetical protein
MSMPPPPPPGDQPPSFSQGPLGPQSGQGGQFGQQPYGTPPPGYAPYGQAFTPGPAQQGRSGMAVAGLVLGIISLVPCFWFFLQLPGILGLIFSLIGLKATKNGLRPGRGLAVAGLVMSILGIVATVGTVLFLLNSDSCVRTGNTWECNFD